MEANNEEAMKMSLDFKQGFNKGYILREYKPNLALSLSQTKFPETEKEFYNGLLKGIEQKEMELKKEKSKSYSIESLRKEYKDIIPNKVKGKDIDRD